MADRNCRNCRKCGKYVPWQITVDGITKHLHGRKFCLDCSPYGEHNTRTDDPAKPATRPSRFRKWSKERKLLHTARVYRKGLERKAKLIELAGGQCQNCGYNKCHRALQFHHRVPGDKKFGLVLNNMWSKSLESILAEAKKCDLLCANCHAEVEDEKSAVNANTYKSIIKELEVIRHVKPKSWINCPCCNANFQQSFFQQVYCSDECHRKHQRKVKDRPSKDELDFLISTMTWVAMGKKYGVSDNAVRKWARGYGLLPRKAS